MTDFRLYQGDCLEVMRGMADDSVDAVVTDPPYGLRFMGKKWDYDVPSVDVWREALRVLKPGGHLLSFGGSRTYHRMVVAIEDAGFEVRDTVMWVYGSGFPKSLDVSKAIDKAAGKLQTQSSGFSYAGDDGRDAELKQTLSFRSDYGYSYSPATPAALQWDGWGTALKPAVEPICLARKPLAEPTVAKNVLRWGTGALNIDGCRVGTESTLRTNGHTAIWANNGGMNDEQGGSPAGRFPANLIHDGSAEVLAGFPMTTSNDPGTTHVRSGEGWGFSAERRNTGYAGDSGSAARFFYCAKASRADRDEGCEGLEERTAIARHVMSGLPDLRMSHEQARNSSHNHHPTVKPTALMRYLVRLVTPPGGVVLDPFMGSGSTGKACALEGFGFVGIEIDAEYLAIARARIDAARVVQPLPLEEAAS